jgi:class 3 adenylate cyclase
VADEFAESKIDLVVLHVDLVGSTKMSMTLSIDKLSAIIRAFAQEISSAISSYGGYVLKYIGDAVLAYFVIEKIELGSNGGGEQYYFIPIFVTD